MGGTVDEKRTSLTNESETCEAKLSTINELYTIIASLGIKSLETFHEERAHFYKKTFGKVCKEELGHAKVMMNFYMGHGEGEEGLL